MWMKGALLVICGLATCNSRLIKPSPELTRARVERVLQQHPVVDGHNDFPLSLRHGLKNDVDQLDFYADLSVDGPFVSKAYSNQTDLPRLRKLGKCLNSYICY